MFKKLGSVLSGLITKNESGEALHKRKPSNCSKTKREEKQCLCETNHCFLASSSFLNVAELQTKSNPPGLWPGMTLLLHP